MFKTIFKITGTFLTGLLMAAGLGFGMELGKDTYNQIKTDNSNKEEAQ